MDKNSALILSTDSEFLKYFKDYRGFGVDKPAASNEGQEASRW
jgi:hypothetical protein